MHKSKPETALQWVQLAGVMVCVARILDVRTPPMGATKHGQRWKWSIRSTRRSVTFTQKKLRNWKGFASMSSEEGHVQGRDHHCKGELEAYDLMWCNDCTKHWRHVVVRGSDPWSEDTAHVDYRTRTKVKIIKAIKETKQTLFLRFDLRNESNLFR